MKKSSKEILLAIRCKTLGSFLVIINRVSYNLLKKLNYIGGRKYNLVWSLKKLDQNSQIKGDKREEVITKQCLLIGKTRFVIKGSGISLNIYSENESVLEKTFTTYFLQEEAIGLCVKETKKNLTFRQEVSSVAYLQGCYISLLNPASENWMHFISEVLPICSKINEKYSNRDVGIIIDEHIPTQAKDLIRMILPQYRIIEVIKGAVIRVEELITPRTQSAYSGFWPRSKEDKTGEYNFCEEAIRHIKDEIDRSAIKSLYQQKLVVKRNGDRVIENQNELLSLLEQQGFQVIEPEKNSIEENLKQFNSAPVVVAQAGAALANMLFMPKASTLVCLVANTKYIDVKYFELFAKICEVDIKFIFGSVTSPRRYTTKALFDCRHPMNATFSVSEEDVIRQINT
jgi:hypothetical protein